MKTRELFLGIVLCAFFAACDGPEKGRDVSPVFSDTVEDQIYTRSSQITPLTLPEATGGSGQLEYSLSPLPDGLVFDSGTRVLSGSPTTFGNTVLTYTAQDEDGNTATLTFSVTVPDTQPSFTDTVEDQVYIQNLQITPLTLPEATGGNGLLQYSLGPLPLPDGLVFDSGTRVLSGSPTTLSNTPLTYTAQDEDGDTATLTFSVAVTNARPSFSDTIAAQEYIQNSEINPLDLPVATDGDTPLEYSLTDLPDGLSLMGGQLVGTPTEVVSGRSVTYTATDANGDTATLMFSVTVAEDTHPSFGETIPPQNYVRGIPISSYDDFILPEATGGNLPLEYSLASQPDGLIFDSATRELSSAPTTVGSTIVTYTVSDIDGDEDTIMFNVAVREQIPKNICDRTQQVRDNLLAQVHANTMDTTIICSAVPEYQLWRIQAIHLQRQGFTELKNIDFDDLPNLWILNLRSNSDLITLPEDVFDGLPYLNSLFLSGHGLTSVPDGLFEGLGNLQTLLLDPSRSFFGPQEGLTSISESLFDGLENLQHLTLNNNPLTSISRAMFDGLPNLQRLSLASSGLTSLPEDVFSGFPELQELRLDSNTFTTLPANVFDGLSNLQELGLNSVGLTAIPDGLFDGLGSLSALHLNSNALTTIPDGAFNDLASLSSLDLQRNSLTMIPSALTSLTSLTSLSLNNNTLTTISDGIFDGSTFSSLTRLNLNSCGLTTLAADTFSGLTGLETLNLNFNRAIELVSGLFSGLPLTTLTLNGAGLTTLPTDVFDGLTSLTSLDLGGNSGFAPESGLFSGLTSLETLNFRFNNINTLPADLFDGLTSLKCLDLRNNTIMPLPEICNSEGIISCMGFRLFVSGDSERCL